MDELSTFLGLLCTLLGAFITFCGVYIYKGEIGKVAVFRIASNDKEEWSDAPLARTLAKASKCAMWGLGFIFCGTLLQIVPIINKLCC